MNVMQQHATAGYASVKGSPSVAKDLFVQMKYRQVKRAVHRDTFGFFVMFQYIYICLLYIMICINRSIYIYIVHHSFVSQSQRV